MLVGSRRLLVMDEISTGLDSATLYSIIQYLRRVGGREGGWMGGGGGTLYSIMQYLRRVGGRGG